MSEEKKPYLDRIEFHQELTVCKKRLKDSSISREKVLTERALKMFMLLAREVSRDFYFDDDEDRKDAIAVATHDLFKYWQNFKESNVVQLRINRNFIVLDQIVIDIYGHSQLTYTAGFDQNCDTRTFKVGKNINESLKHLKWIIDEKDSEAIAIFVDKIKNKITLQDKYNADNLSVKSSVSIISPEYPVSDFVGKTDQIQSIDKVYLVDKNKSGNFVFFFTAPPNAFSYFTSISRRGILKSLSKTNPKQFRNGNKVSMDQINRQNGGDGMFNI